MKNKAVWITLLLIVVLGAFLRLKGLANVPVSPDWDEVSLGYNAYSILHTGSDEYGKFLPTILRSFNDYKPALYAYLTIPSIFVFGLNVFAVRLPSAIFGILSLIGVFYLVREIFEAYRYKNYLALISTFLLAISPWHIQFSRVAFEANIGVAFNIFTALFFLKGLKKPWALSVSAVFAGFSVYAYQSEKVFVPMLILIMGFIYRKKLFSISKKYLASALIIGALIVLPMVVSILADASSLGRLRGTSIFSSQTELLKVNQRKLDRDQQNNDKLGLLLDNRRIIYAKAITQGYLSHFDLNWLFIKGDIARHHAHGMGMVYLFELPLLFLGIYGLFVSKKFEKKAKLFIFLWILAAPIPASVTQDLPSAVRTLNFLPAFQILSSIGILSIYEFLKSKRSTGRYFYILILMPYLLFCLFNFAYYLNQYFVQSSYYDSSYWQYGYKEAVEESLKLQGKYEKIIVSNNETMSQSYIFFLFYLKYPPEDYQKISENKLKNTTDKSFGKYTFRKIYWKKDSQIKNILYIANPKDIPGDVQPIKTINNLDGTPAMVIIGT